MVTITLKHGICKYSPSGFCDFGSALCNKDNVVGCQFGQAVIMLSKRLNAK